MKIEINYKNPQKPRGPVGGTPTVALNSNFSFFSHDGALEVQFVEHSPLEGDAPPRRIPGDTVLKASKPGRFHFQCFLDGVELPEDGGGELEIPPAM